MNGVKVALINLSKSELFIYQVADFTWSASLLPIILALNLLSKVPSCMQPLLSI